ncbi:helix-turn-helix domain-containing protein [Acidisoma cellulosilytica]|uniref:Helix-turn-helix domain-containing protein n=1 Tax=Acidisoma cellulosilyticum TaxID=2802395 RepID=A0A963Z687_9PROT|nr:helix-turn-helix domain-containing protein [Acidisoma cellulosilyticum]MCB8883256.1 helix-turn-helix domain-containing protein [Acidisoma cellulosilyticum]
MGSFQTPISEPLCPPGTQPAGTLAVYSADVVPQPSRQKYWLGAVFRRVASAAEPDDAAPFHARLTRVGGESAELLDHTGSSLLARRDAAHCRADQCDDLIVDFMVQASRACVDHGFGCRRPTAGDMLILDLGRPLELTHARHRIISLFLPRAKVRSVFADPSLLAGRLLQRRGIAALLRSHMQMTIDQADCLTPAERVAAVAAAVDMALLAIQREAGQPIEAEQLSPGLYTAATTLIGRDFRNPDFNADTVVQNLGCARATLYRVFAAQDQSIAKSIWTRRLHEARRMLASGENRHLLIEEVAFRCGFTDIPTFNRMFKRQYQSKPGDIRGQMS